MRAFAVTAVFAASLIAAAPAGAASGGAKQRSILVLAMKGDPSVIDAATLTTITSTISVAVSKRKGLNVLTEQDVKNLVDVEAQRQMLGCTPGSESCLAEVANAMGAELVLSGDAGKLGSAYVINLHLFDAAKARSVGRDTVTVSDLALLPQTLEASIAGLLTPITGEAGLTSKTSGVSIPTVDTNALKSGGLKAINMQAETALEKAMDMQDDASARPEAKRDAWCALAQVPGSNPYLGPASKACEEWTSYVNASAQLEQSLAADYDTLAGFLQLKRKTKQQKLEAVDSFLQSYSRLDNDDVKSVQDARRKIADGDKDVTLPARKSGPVTPDPYVAPEPEGPGLFDGCFDGVGCLALNFDDAPHFGLVLGTHLSLMDDITKPDTLSPQFPPSLIMGTRLAWSFFEGGLALDIDFIHGKSKLDTFADADQNGFVDDTDGNGFPDNDNDGLKDDVDGDDVNPCNVQGSTCTAVKPDGDAQYDAGVFFQGYVGLQTINVTVEDVTFIRPSFGFDVYTDFETNDVGIYVANTISITNLMQLRGFLRTNINGEHLVPSVQLGLEGSLDYLSLIED